MSRGLGRKTRPAGPLRGSTGTPVLPRFFAIKNDGSRPPVAAALPIAAPAAATGRRVPAYRRTLRKLPPTHPQSNFAVFTKQSA
jgi:hypothetical protein